MVQKTKLMLVLQTLFVVFFLVLHPLNTIATSSVVVVSDNFEATTVDGLNDWTLQGYNLVSSKLVPITNGFTLNNGSLMAPSDPTYGDGYSRAYHPSNASYGSWSVDWTPSPSQQTYDAFEFLLTDYASNPNNLSGRTFPEIDHYAGYALTLISYKTDVGPGLWLVKFQNSSSPLKPLILAHYSFDAPITGTHKIEINRDLTGNFTIFFDSVQRIQAVDTTFTHSEVFSFVSFQGNSSIDNIEIKSLPSETNSSGVPFSNLQFIFFAFVFSAFVVLLKRKKKI